VTTNPPPPFPSFYGITPEAEEEDLQPGEPVGASDAERTRESED